MRSKASLPARRKPQRDGVADDTAGRGRSAQPGRASGLGSFELPQHRNLQLGSGVFEKPPIEGATTSARTLFRVRAKQFIYSRLFAFEGAYGLVPDEYDGCFVSNEFPAFDIDQERLCPGVPRTALQAAKHLENPGRANRRNGRSPTENKARSASRHAIPLPPLAEQRRIVAKIERLVAKIDEAQGLRPSANEKVKALLPASINSVISGPSVTLDEVVNPERGNHYGIVQAGSNVPDGIPYIRVSDMQAFS